MWHVHIWSPIKIRSYRGMGCIHVCEKKWEKNPLFKKITKFWDRNMPTMFKILMKCHFKATLYVYILLFFSMREGVVTKSTIFMKKNRLWKPYPTVLVVYDHFLRVASMVSKCVHHTPDPGCEKSTLSNHFCLVIFICILKFHL